MRSKCLPPSLGSIWLGFCMQMWFEDFKDGHHSSHHGYWNRTILAILNLYVTLMLPIKFRLNQTCAFGGGVVWRILRWLLGNQNIMILAILNFYVAPMPPIKFLPNPTYGLGQDVVWRISRWQPWRPSWISERKDLCNSESLFYVTGMPPIKFKLNPTRFGRRCSLKNFKMAAILDIRTELF